MSKTKNEARPEAETQSVDKNKKSYQAPVIVKVQQLAQVTGLQKVTGV